MWPGEPMRIGREFMIADKRVVLVGVCYASAPFTTMPVLYTRMSGVERFMPQQRSVMNYILAKPKPGVSEDEVCRQIESATGLVALARDGFFWKTIDYFLVRQAFQSTLESQSRWTHLWCRRLWTDVLSVYSRESTSIRFAQSDGSDQHASHLDGLVVGLYRWLHGLRVGALNFDGDVFHLYESNHALGRYPHDFGGCLGCGISVLTMTFCSRVWLVAEVLRLEPAIVFRG